MKNKTLEFKTVKDSVLDIDTTGRRVKVVIANTGNRDLQDDVIEAGAFTKTIAERGPAGANMIWHLTDHNPSLKHAINKFSELYMQGSQLVGITDFPKTAWANDVLELYRVKAVNQHSIGFRTVKAEDRQQENTRLIKEVYLLEGSSVLWGANPLTPTLDMKGVDIDRQHIADELSNIAMILKDANVSDYLCELLEAKQETYNEILNTLPATIAVEPSNEIVEIIKNFNLKLENGRLNKAIRDLTGRS